MRGIQHKQGECAEGSRMCCKIWITNGCGAIGCVEARLCDPCCGGAPPAGVWAGVGARRVAHWSWLVALMRSGM